MKINLTVCADNIRTVWTVVLRRKCVGRRPFVSIPRLKTPPRRARLTQQYLSFPQLLNLFSRSKLLAKEHAILNMWPPIVCKPTFFGLLFALT